MSKLEGIQELLLAAWAGVGCLIVLVLRWTDIAWPRVFLPGFFAWLAADSLTAWAMVGKPPRVKLPWMRLQGIAALVFGVVAVVAGCELLSGGRWRWFDLTGTLAGAFIGLGALYYAIVASEPFNMK